MNKMEVNPIVTKCTTIAELNSEVLTLRESVKKLSQVQENSSAYDHMECVDRYVYSQRELSDFEVLEITQLIYSKMKEFLSKREEELEGLLKEFTND